MVVDFLAEEDAATQAGNHFLKERAIFIFDLEAGLQVQQVTTCLI